MKLTLYNKSSRKIAYNNGKGHASRLYVTATTAAAKYFYSIERRDILHYIIKKK